MNVELQNKKIEDNARNLEKDYSPEQIQKTVDALEKIFTDFPKENMVSPKIAEAMSDLVTELKLDPIHFIAFFIVRQGIKLVN